MTDSTPSISSTNDIVRATSRGRWILLLAIALAIGALAYYYFAALPFLKASLSGGLTPHALVTIKSVLIGIAAASVLFGFFIVRYGQKILRNGQFPLSDAWVWRDTAVKRGIHARRFAWLHILVGILVGLLCVGLALYIWITIERFIVPQHKLPPGVIILHEGSIKKP